MDHPARMSKTELSCMVYPGHGQCKMLSVKSNIEAFGPTDRAQNPLTRECGLNHLTSFNSQLSMIFPEYSLIKGYSVTGAG